MAMHRTHHRRTLCRSRHARLCVETPGWVDPRKVVDLRDKLLGATELDGIMNYFLEHFGADARFMRLGVPLHDEKLACLLGKAVGCMRGSGPKCMQVCFLHLPEHRMAHGVVRFEGWLGIAFFFEDLGVGLCALCDASLCGPSIYGRFRLLSPSQAPEIRLH